MTFTSLSMHRPEVHKLPPCFTASPLPSLPQLAAPSLARSLHPLTLATMASTAFSSNQGFISFSPSPEPEGPPPPPVLSRPSTAAIESNPPSTATRHADALASSSSSSARPKRSRDERDARSHSQHHHQELEADDPAAFRNRKEERRASSRSTPWVDGVDWLYVSALSLPRVLSSSTARLRSIGRSDDCLKTPS